MKVEKPKSVDLPLKKYRNLLCFGWMYEEEKKPISGFLEEEAVWGQGCVEE